MTKRGALVALVGAVAGTLAAFAQSTWPIRFNDEAEQAVSRAHVAIDAIELEAVRWTVRTTAPFACDADHVGYVYLQQDVPNFTGPSHELCICRATDLGGPVTYLWQGLTGSVACASLT